MAHSGIPMRVASQPQGVSGTDVVPTTGQTRDGAHGRRDDRRAARPRCPLIGAGVATVLAVPGIAADADLGPWYFAVTAAGSREFREVYAFHSRRACEERRGAIGQGVARVVADHGGTTVGGLARRLHLGPCEAVRRGR